MTIYHNHHIIPKHMGGTNHPDNLVKVTIEQHASLHKQLWEDLWHEEDKIAWLCLSGQITMEDAKREAIRLGQLKSAEQNRNRKWSEEEKKKLRGPRGKYKKRKPMPPRPDSIKEKIRKKLKGQKHTVERIEANRQGQIERFKNPDERQKIAEQLKLARSCRKDKI